jgi:hypothetical protein
VSKRLTEEIKQQWLQFRTDQLNDQDYFDVDGFEPAEEDEDLIDELLKLPIKVVFDV